MVNSNELITIARDIVRRELERSIEKDKQPSLYEICYEAYIKGYSDGSGADKDSLKQRLCEWHYIDVEGCPKDDDKYWCLVKCDGWYDTVEGWYEEDKDIWNLEYKNQYFEKVVAWHKLPDIPK